MAGESGHERSPEPERLVTSLVFSFDALLVIPCLYISFHGVTPLNHD